MIHPKRENKYFVIQIIETPDSTIFLISSSIFKAIRFSKSVTSETLVSL